MKKSFHEESEYKCDEGKYQETNEINYEDHKKSAHGGIKYICEECNYDTTEERAINTHKKYHEAEKITCDKCQYLATNERHLNDHYQLMHEDNTKESEKDMSGPGYMGWRIPEMEKDDKEATFEAKLEELKILYETLKSEFSALKAEFEVTGKKLQEKNIESKQTKKEIAILKEDYKDCMKVIKEETLARNKAEEMVKVLEETLDAKAEKERIFLAEKHINNDEEVVENMDIEEDEWKEVTSKKKKHKAINSCDLCKQKFTLVDALNEHMKKHVDIGSFKCTNCNESFETQIQLKNHMSIHSDFGKCGKRDINHEDMKKHKSEHVPVVNSNCQKRDATFDASKLSIGQNKESNARRHPQEFNCEKCVKTYSTMDKLRRHDWRSHRQIKCNICDDTIQSREEISNHRKIKHNMLRKAACKFYPACYDGEECFFSHDNSENSIADQDKPSPFCPNGIECDDQGCQYGEYSHKNVKEIDCKFQSSCNRKNCPFVHLVARKAFLGENRTSQKGT